MTWHDDPDKRIQVGDLYEKEWGKTILCYCHFGWEYTGDLYPGSPDWTCRNCGQLVDVKYSPLAETTGNLDVSVVPWNNYPDDVFIVSKIKGRWIGEFKGHIKLLPGRHAPTHQAGGHKFGNTYFYLFPWSQLIPIGEFLFKKFESELTAKEPDTRL